MKAYPAYKESGVEWLGKFPEHWKLARIKHILKSRKNSIKTGPFGSQLKNSDMEGTDVKVYNQRNVIDNDFDNGDNFISYKKFDELKEFEIFPGDILITTRGTIGRCAVFPDNASKGVLHPCLIRIQPDENLVDDRFILWFIQESALFKESIFFESNATTIEVIYSNTLKQVALPIPPLPEQQAIADFLDRKTAQIDTLIEKKQRQIDLLQEQRAALINHAVTKGLNPDVRMKDSGVEWLGEIPSHWEVEELRRHWKIIDCKHRTATYIDSEGIPIVSTTEIKPGRLSLQKTRLTTREDYLDLAEGERKPKRGDIIYSRNASLGSAAFVDTDQEFCMGQDVCLITSDNQNQLFLSYQLNSPVVLRQLESMVVGATFKRINIGQILLFDVVRPPVEEQVAIAHYLDLMTSKIDNLIRIIQRTIEFQKEYRTALISEAVTGKIDVRK